ncbi:hypothetical protein CTRC69_00235 [Chlamydia trachomatis RC-F/69]|nr:hypothetical protein CTL2C_73 [Chlamydia trachomatis L2c]AGJ64397.1 hypothetical protein CTLINITIAL_01585 [Chlamydia trachomatis L2/434/Bu(i)]AGJ65337.1 hypothetical protein CTLFINAL_01585 [Chlamydia trachomatis L2/434/Bu(f)]AGR93458.1 hypothetical protein CTRC69_00235 [Chlamydia trachomatis RC-F/69]AGR94382.1 hypothetical protein CTRC46_00235 [Chlamydia trachomatis RC-L2(s)/46]AGR96260.1 hypothetical protein CTRC943_00230 [Chlamydia trachomatis RC-J/943]AGR97187.1 hypothetical protein CTR
MFLFSYNSQAVLSWASFRRDFFSVTGAYSIHLIQSHILRSS